MLFRLSIGFVTWLTLALFLTQLRRQGWLQWDNGWADTLLLTTFLLIGFGAVFYRRDE